MTAALAALTGFLAGSVPFGLLLTRLTGRVDPRTIGSGNVGATNVVRASGLGLGLATLLLDAAKGWLPAAAFAQAAGPSAGAIAGLAAVLGHCFSPWLRLRGGKGVATLLGVVGALAWPWGLLAFVVAWLATVGLLRFASVSSLVASWIAPLVAWRTGSGREALLALVAAALVVTLRHHSNLRRLVRGEEPRFGSRRGGSKAEGS
jgi:glycerol-3-phosphate acyltransferase PlsY